MQALGQPSLLLAFADTACARTSGSGQRSPLPASQYAPSVSREALPEHQPRHCPLSGSASGFLLGFQTGSCL